MTISRADVISRRTHGSYERKHGGKLGKQPPKGYVAAAVSKVDHAEAVEASAGQPAFRYGATGIESPRVVVEKIQYAISELRRKTWRGARGIHRMRRIREPRMGEKHSFLIAGGVVFRGFVRIIWWY